MHVRAFLVGVVALLGVAGWNVPARGQPALSQPGVYHAGWRQVTITRPGGSTFTARLFYPGQTGGRTPRLIARARRIRR